MENRVTMGESPPPVDEAFARLLAENQRRIFAFILTLLPNREDAEDVFQDVSVVLWKKSSQFEWGTDFSRWAFQIAYFEVVNHRRKKSRSRLCFHDELMRTLAEDLSEPDPLFQFRRLALADCLTRLRADDRRLLALRYEEGISVQMLADRQQSSIRKIYRTLERLRQQLFLCIERKVWERETT
jgi:RNA polymerase sigma-70 factor (ECF subfamily)